MFTTTRPVDQNRLILGVWLLASPWLLEYADATAAAWTAWTVGAIVAALAFVKHGSGHARTARAVGILAGDLLFLAPWMLGYADIRMAAVNSWIVGLAVAGLAAWELTDHRDPTRTGHRIGRRTQ